MFAENKIEYLYIMLVIVFKHAFVKFDIFF